MKKHIYIDSVFLVMITIFFAILLIGKKKTLLDRLIYRLNTIVFILSLLLYLALQILEAYHFRNYVFSTYHLQPNSLLYLVVLSFVIFLILKPRETNIDISNKRMGVLIVTVSFFLLSIGGIVDIINNAVYSDIYVFLHWNSSYDLKMTERWGIYYQYIQFVKNNTPENSTILVPPQELPWYSTGNVALDLYFLFPRTLGNGNFNNSIDLEKYDYVMLSWGEWNGVEKDKYGWPKEKIKAEKIIYFDPKTKSVIEEKKDYDPGDTVSGVWGIIRVKK